MSKYINNGQPTLIWNGISAEILLRRCEQGDMKYAGVMSHVASLMQNGDPITFEEFEAARTARNAVERGLMCTLTLNFKGGFITAEEFARAAYDLFWEDATVNGQPEPQPV